MTSIAQGGSQAGRRRRGQIDRRSGGWRLGLRIGLSLAVLIGAGFGVGTAVGYGLVKAFTLVHLGTAP